jgi:hypothetical protein
MGDTRFRQRQPAGAVLRQSHCVPRVYPSAGLFRPTKAPRSSGKSLKSLEAPIDSLA